MIKFLKDLISQNDETENIDLPADMDSKYKRVEIATCALLIEVANSDDEFSEEEKELILKLMKSEFKLNDTEMHELMELSDQHIEESVSLYEFTNIINENFNPDEKFAVLKNLWRLILVDGRLDTHEEYFIRKISKNLHLQHKDLIAAKFEVKKESN